MNGNSQLSNPWSLLSQAWNIFSKRAITLWGIMLFPFAYVLIAALVGGFLIGMFRMRLESAVSLLLIDAGIIIFVILFLWSQVSLIYSIVDEKLSIKEAYGKSRTMIWDYVVLSFLVGLVVLGGFVIFIIPGIILSAYLTFSVYALVNEGEKETNALLKSYEYVKGHWWAVFGRIAFIALVFLVAIWLIEGFFGLLGLHGSISKAWTNVLSLFFAPLATIYYYLMYKNLKSIKGHFNLPAKQDKRGLFVGLAVFSFLILVAVVIVFSKSPCLSNMSNYLPMMQGLY
jgi:hypothetical protein